MFDLPKENNVKELKPKEEKKRRGKGMPYDEAVNIHAVVKHAGSVDAAEKILGYTGGISSAKFDNWATVRMENSAKFFMEALSLRKKLNERQANQPVITIQGPKNVIDALKEQCAQHGCKILAK